jgi:hypothetical protein
MKREGPSLLGEPPGMNAVANERTEPEELKGEEGGGEEGRREEGGGGGRRREEEEGGEMGRPEGRQHSAPLPGAQEPVPGPRD